MSITLQEIKNQYQALEKTISLFCKRSEEMKGFFTQAAPRALLFTGCGSSYAVARSMRSVAVARFDLPSTRCPPAICGSTRKATGRCCKTHLSSLCPDPDIQAKS